MQSKCINYFKQKSIEEFHYEFIPAVFLQDLYHQMEYKILLEVSPLDRGIHFTLH